ncbi:GntR family transcriptional regulator [Streptomyces justiciae]|uniref:GntR family transcriptional regulator n=1 Tax=Streptomyces justiciae TaxID=2780140 RepID=UPI002117BBCD|nr:GntR family transcriptional regulator [Streptomyces justiciae]MCW8384644.1 GntR family transcriptional regulator [Streptomyces justiciae]
MSDSDLDAASLGEAAYRRLRADIVSCRLAPGERITERGLAAATGFGMSPIRDALRRLDHDGLVRTLPRKGYQVKPLTIKTVDDLFDFWSVLGPEVARRGLPRTTDEQIERIIAGRDEIMRLTKETGHTREVALRTVEILDEMFTTLAEAADNDYLTNAHVRVSAELARVWTLVAESELMDPGVELPVQQEGWKEDILRRDGAKCAQLVRAHIEQSHNRVLRMLVRWPSVIAAEVVPLGRTARQRQG